MTAPEYRLIARRERLDLGILEGDSVAVRETDKAEPGEVVVVRSPDGSDTLARYDGTQRVVGLVFEVARRV